MAEALKREQRRTRGQEIKTIDRFKERNKHKNGERIRADISFTESLCQKMTYLVFFPHAGYNGAAHIQQIIL